MYEMYICIFLMTHITQNYPISENDPHTRVSLFVASLQVAELTQVWIQVFKSTT